MHEVHARTENFEYAAPPCCPCSLGKPDFGCLTIFLDFSNGRMRHILISVPFEKAFSRWRRLFARTAATTFLDMAVRRSDLYESPVECHQSSNYAAEFARSKPSGALTNDLTG